MLNLPNQLFSLLALFCDQVADTEVGEYNRLCLQQIVEQVEVCEQALILLYCINVPSRSLHVN